MKNCLWYYDNIFQIFSKKYYDLKNELQVQEEEEEEGEKMMEPGSGKSCAPQVQLKPTPIVRVLLVILIYTMYNV